MFRSFARLILGLGLASTFALPLFGESEPTNPPLPGGPPPPPKDDCDKCKGGASDSGATGNGQCTNASHSASMASVFFTMDIGRAHFEPQMDIVRYSLMPGTIWVPALDGAKETNFDEIFKSYRSRPLSAQRQFKIWYEQKRLAAEGVTWAHLAADEESKAELIRAYNNGPPKQVITTDYFTDVSGLSSAVIAELPTDLQALLSGAGVGFVIRCWEAGEQGALSAGLYTLPTTEPLRYVLFYNPDSTNQGRMNIVHRAKYNSTQFKTLSYCYHEDGTTHDWTMTSHDGLPATQAIEETTLDVTGWDTNQDLATVQTRTVKRVDLSATGAYGSTLNTISVSQEKFQTYDGKQRMIEETKGFGTAHPRTTKYFYYDSTAEPAFRGRVKAVVHPDGRFEYLDYSYPSANGLTIGRTRSWENSAWDLSSPYPPGIIETRSSTSGTVTALGITYTTSSTEVEERLGTLLISKKKEEWSVETSSGDKTYSESRAVKSNTTTGYDQVHFKECFHANNSDNLRKGKLKWRSNEDGTFTNCTYQSVGGSTLHHIRTVETGDGSVLGMTSGTRTVTEINQQGYAIKEDVYHFHGTTSVLLNSWVSASEDFFGRPTKRIYNLAKNGHSNDYDETTYGCCGVSSFRDRNGITTQYYRDGFKREYRQVETAGTKVVTTSTAYTGRETTVTRSATGIDLLVSSTLRRENGEIETVTGPDQNADAILEVTSYAYSYPSGGGRVQTITYPDGGTEVRKYFADGSLEEVSGTAVAPRKFDYDKHTIDGGGLSTLVTYPTTASASGHWEKKYYDLGGRLFKTEYPTQINSPGTNDFATLTYDGPTGRIHQRTDADGAIVTYTYDGEANLATVTEPMPGSVGNKVTSYTHQGVNDTAFGGSIQNTTAVNGVTVSVTTGSGDGYGSRTASLGRTTTQVRSLGSGGAWTVTTIRPDNTYSVQQYQHGELSLTGLYQPSNALVESTGFTYDAIGRLASSVHSRKGTTLYNAYTPSGLPLSVTDPGSRTTSFTYDRMGRVVETNAPDTLSATGATIPNVTKTSYYKTGKVEAVWGDQTYPTFHAYDEQGRMIELRTYRSLSSSTQPTASEAGADLTTWAYHANTGRLVSKRDNANNGANYSYTAAGRLKTRTWDRGAHTRYDYTTGKLVGVRYFTSAASNTGSNAGNDSNTPDLGYTYDYFGRITQVSRGGTSHFTYTYDADELYLATETQNDASFEQRLLTRKRDSLLRPAGYLLGTAADPDAISEVTHAYDTAGRLDSVTYQRIPGAGTPPAAQAFSYDFEADSYGLIKTVTGPTHTVENTWEADRDLLSAKENDWSMAPVSHYYYSLNALGQRTAVEIDGLGTGGLVTWDWGYDAKGQVVKGDASSGSGATADDRFYDYDQIGNRKQSRTGTFSSTGGTATEYFADTAATTVGANGLNQYQAIKTGGVTRNPVHDSDGNLTDDGANWDYVWDGENRMVSATPKSTSGTRKIIYKYDHLGRLFERELQIWNGSAWAYHESYRYVYDGWNRIESCVNWMGLRDEYIWGLDLSGTPQGAGGVGGMLLWSTTYDYGANWKNYYPAYDGNGNVTELINGTGTVAAHWEYDPFGNILRSTAAGTWSDPVNLFEFRFSTKPQDRNTGLYYYGYRFYDPVTGRWPRRDPIGENGGTNLYSFVTNEGLSRFDFLGLDPMRPWDMGGNDDPNQQDREDAEKQAEEKAAEERKKDTKCCTKEKIAQGRQELVKRFGKTQQALSDDGRATGAREEDIESGAAGSNRSCHSMNSDIWAGLNGFEDTIKDQHGKSLMEEDPTTNGTPPCWQCSLEGGFKIQLSLPVVKNHFWVTCAAYDTEGKLVEELLFDIWTKSPKIGVPIGEDGVRGRFPFVENGREGMLKPCSK